MKIIDPNDIVNALAHCDQHELAQALAASDDPSFARLSDALLSAANHRASYPRHELIEEGDALLYDVLRWPVEDANPAGITIDPISYARQHQVSIMEAERVLNHVAATESQACDQLLASGAAPNFTLEQSQVYDCIVSLRMQHRIPTRHLVRQHAERIATAAMRPEDGPAPVIYPDDPTLAPRVVSPSPKVHVLLWMDRMDTHPPTTALLEDRIAHVVAGKSSMGASSCTATYMASNGMSFSENAAPNLPPAAGLRLAG